MCPLICHSSPISDGPTTTRPRSCGTLSWYFLWSGNDPSIEWPPCLFPLVRNSFFAEVFCSYFTPRSIFWTIPVFALPFIEIKLICTPTLRSFFLSSPLTPVLVCSVLHDSVIRFGGLNMTLNSFLLEPLGGFKSIPPFAQFSSSDPLLL